MSGNRSGIAAIAFACVSAVAIAQGGAGDPLAVGRKMLAEDNPGELWIDKGKQLFFEKRGPGNASLEQCDFGLGPGKLDGAATRLPRYFSDTDKVQDLESRLLTCMVQLQGHKREEIVRRAISPAGSNGSDVEALALYITSRSSTRKNMTCTRPASTCSTGAAVRPTSRAFSATVNPASASACRTS